MLSELLSPLKGAKAPFASVALDASRLSQATGDDPVERWESQARHLRARGAPEPVIEALGEITLVSHDDVPLHEGIGALLRWSDPATQHLDVPSMPGHGEPPGSSANSE